MALESVAAAMMAVAAVVAEIGLTAMGSLSKVEPVTMVAEVVRIAHHGNTAAGPLT